MSLSKRIEYLALLAPSAQKYEFSPRSTSGEVLTSADVALAVSLLPAVEEALLRLVHLRDSTDIEHLIAELSREIKLYNSSEFTGGRWSEALHKITKLALANVVEPEKCHSCGGRGNTVSEMVCPTCEGRGKNKKTDKRLAKELGISRQQFSNNWKHRYNIVESFISGKLSQAEHNFSKKLAT